MKTVMLTVVMISLFAAAGICDCLHLLWGGKIDGIITEYTERYYFMQVGDYRYKIEKNQVMYVMGRLEPKKTYTENRKSLLLPYIYPYADSFEIGLWITF